MSGETGSWQSAEAHHEGPGRKGPLKALGLEKWPARFQTGEGRGGGCPANRGPARKQMTEAVRQGVERQGPAGSRDQRGHPVEKEKQSDTQQRPANGQLNQKKGTQSRDPVLEIGARGTRRFGRTRAKEIARLQRFSNQVGHPGTQNAIDHRVSARRVSRGRHPPCTCVISLSSQNDRQNRHYFLQDRPGG